MTTAPGTRLGPYEIVGPLGAGGMGEVWKARDPKLDRLVAVKVLPADFAADGERLKRFQQEAKVLAALSHPNLVQVFEAGGHDGAPYLVMELLEGETLRDRLQGRALPARRALEIAQQIAQGLAAAHAKGIVHRDLKPENVFLARDGRVKLLDFGLAKARHLAASSQSATRALGQGGAETGAGMVLGTVGYMSPEQVRGEAADARSDLFALGVVLWEMLTGARPFRGGSPVETMSAILREEPPDLDPALKIGPGLAKLLDTCLAKDPAGRFHSAHDLAYALEGAGGSGSASAPQARTAGWTALRPRSMVVGAGLGALAVAALAGLGWALGWPPFRAAEPPVYRRITFGLGVPTQARFTANGRGVVLGMQRGGAVPQTFLRDLDSFEARPIGPKGAIPVAVSRSGEVALLLQAERVHPSLFRGTLGTTLQVGSLAPKELLPGVHFADFGTAGQLAVVRQADRTCRLEYPLGTLRAETSGWFSSPRIAPEGDLLAYFEHPIPNDNLGRVCVLDLRSGRTRALTGEWFGLNALAWRGREIWFTGSRESSRDAYISSLWALTRAGRLRPVLRLPTDMVLQDIAADGRLLLSCSTDRVGILAGAEGQPIQEISRYEQTQLADLSADGGTVVFQEIAEYAAQGYRIYLWKRDAPSAVHLGEGLEVRPRLSPDGRWVAAIQPKPAPHPVLLPTGAGEPRSLSSHGIVRYDSLGWTADGRLLVSGRQEGQPGRIYVLDPARDMLQPLTSAGSAGTPHVSPDGARCLVFAGAGKSLLVDLGRPEAPPEPVRGLEPGEQVASWCQDSRRVFVTRVRRSVVHCWTLDPRSGRREDWAPVSPEGITARLHRLAFSRDGRAWAVQWSQSQSDLFVVEGVK